MHASNLAGVRFAVRWRLVLRLRVLFLQQIKAQGADKKCGVTLVLGNISRQLRRIHRLGVRHVFKAVDVINHRHRHRDQHQQRISPLASGFFHPVDPFLNWRHYQSPSR